MKKVIFPSVVFAFVFFIIAVSCADIPESGSMKLRYDNHKVFRVTPLTQEHVNHLIRLQNEGLSFWEGPSGKVGTSSDIMISPLQHELVETLRASGMKVHEFINNIQTLMDEELTNSRRSSRSTARLTWDIYNRLGDIELFLDEQAYTHDIAELITIGKTTEGRDLQVIKISKSTAGQEQKPVIFIDSNIHAREWITSAVGTYLVNELLNSEDPKIQSWTDDFDWYVMPVLNPDGFEFTHTNDRMWRKSRSSTSSPLGCKGTDLNRNFDYNWMGGGASNNPCSETFGGNRTHSDPETVAVANFIDTIADHLVLYLSLHSYSQYIMFPFGDTRPPVSQYQNYMRITRAAADAISQRFGTVFTPGNWLDILYLSTGTSMDWVQSKHNVNLSLTYELRDTGRYGFLLPPDQIRPSALEFLDSLESIVGELRNGVPRAET